MAWVLISAALRKWAFIHIKHTSFGWIKELLGLDVVEPLVHEPQRIGCQKDGLLRRNELHGELVGAAVCQGHREPRPQ